jgi:hypothetical protein
MAQQTSLDWYIDKINEMTFEAAIHFQLYKEGKEYEQAKEMEKEQIMNAYIDGEHQQGFEGEAEQYYNETYQYNQVKADN